jgi:hypothetical protein
MAPSFSITLRRVVFYSYFAFANFVVIPVRITCTLVTTTSKSEHEKKRAVGETKKVTT